MQVVRIQKITHGDGKGSYVNVLIRNNGLPGSQLLSLPVIFMNAILRTIDFKMYNAQQY